MTQFMLPLGAPFHEAPEAFMFCTPPVLAWLEKVGMEVPPKQNLSIRNTAEDGAMLSMSNIRAVDVRKSEPERMIRFHCPNAGLGDSVSLDVRLDFDLQAKVRDRETEEYKPFAFNLEPGEQGSIEINFKRDEVYSYSGRMVADVLAGNSVETIELPLDGSGDGFNFVGTGEFTRLEMGPGDYRKKGVFKCTLYDRLKRWREDKGVSNFDCSATQVRYILASMR
ncbi:hypothetical protein [Saccharothrix sp. HUAS TT1]|uniref:hypothetical protein n=1 Tax=unclassified Saccharothrix TaxID=2593673 RepID=UPI00345C03E3